MRLREVFDSVAIAVRRSAETGRPYRVYQHATATWAAPCDDETPVGDSEIATVRPDGTVTLAPHVPEEV